jgi:hypothetical protein
MTANSQRKLDSSVQLFLRIKHPSIDPREISKMMDIEPEHAVQAGQSISAKGKRTLHSESYWIAQLPTPAFPVAISAEALQDHRASLSTASTAEKVTITRQFARNAYALQGLSKEEIVGMIGASRIEMTIMPWLRKVAAQREFLTSINTDGGAITLVVQLRNAEHPLRIRPELARRLADAGIELEIDHSV